MKREDLRSIKEKITSSDLIRSQDRKIKMMRYCKEE